MQKQTKSEGLFLQYCAVRGYTVNRIPTPGDGEQFADYEVLIGNSRLIVEVKEVRPNATDQNVTRAMREGHVQVFGDEPGRRIRNHIEHAERQRRRYQDQSVPCLVVLHDNIVVDGFRPYPPGGFLQDMANPLFPYHIDVGMYGLQTVKLRLHQNGPVECLGDVRGGKRTLRSGHHEHVSAVATLHDYDQNYGLFLIVYHNFFANHPLPRDVFANSKDKQLEKSAHPDCCPGEWQPVKAAQP